MYIDLREKECEEGQGKRETIIWKIESYKNPFSIRKTKIK